jgi:hypothetical protein
MNKKIFIIKVLVRECRCVNSGLIEKKFKIVVDDDKSTYIAYLNNNEIFCGDWEDNFVPGIKNFINRVK